MLSRSFRPFHACGWDRDAGRALYVQITSRHFRERFASGIFSSEPTSHNGGADAIREYRRRRLPVLVLAARLFSSCPIDYRPAECIISINASYPFMRRVHVEVFWLYAYSANDSPSLDSKSSILGCVQVRCLGQRLLKALDLLCLGASGSTNHRCCGAQWLYKAPSGMQPTSLPGMARHESCSTSKCVALDDLKTAGQR